MDLIQATAKVTLETGSTHNVDLMLYPANSGNFSSIVCQDARTICELAHVEKFTAATAFGAVRIQTSGEPKIPGVTTSDDVAHVLVLNWAFCSGHDQGAAPLV